MSQPLPPRLSLTSLGLIAALAGIACADAPIAQKYAARAAVQKARDAGAAQLASDALTSAEDSLAACTRLLNLQLQRMRWNRSFGRVEACFDTATRRAELAEAFSRGQNERAKDRAQQLLLRADSGFDQMEWLSTYIPPRSAIRADVKKASISYAEAQALFKQGLYPRAVAAAQQANVGIDAAYRRFSRFIQSSTDPSRREQYARWVNETIAWTMSHDAKAIIVDKMRRTLTLVSDGRRARTYKAELGINGTMNKVVAGDRATPEGQYRITEKRGPRQTRWYKALLLNYPNDDDLQRFRQALRRGQISGRARPGGLIEIHGEGGRGGDWTDGCIALDNRDMDDLFDRVSVDTRVTIVGYDGSGDAAGPSPRRTASGPPPRGRTAGAAGGR